jgi:hypothetical protein
MEAIYMKQVFAIVAVCVINFHAAALAGEDSLTLKASGWAAFTYQMIGRGVTVEGATYTDISIVNLRENPNLIGLFSLDGRLNDRTGFTLAAYGSLEYDYHHYKASIQYMPYVPTPRLFLHQIEGRHTFGDPEQWPVKVGVGYFPYKYNDDASHLGEYLFRSNAYPQIIYNNFEFAKEYLLGMRISNDLLSGIFHHDLIVNFETRLYPYKDIGLGYVANIHVPEMLDIGAGFHAIHLITAREELVTPTWDRRTQSVPTDSDRVKYPYVDSTGQLQDFYDSTVYSFRGLKLMAKVAFDPKGLLPVLNEFSNPCDWRLYVEAAVLGVKNYGLYYPDIMKRIPVMFGFNVPTMKVLSKLAVEFEYFETDYLNNPYQVEFYLWPIPVQPRVKAPFKNSQWKWTVYAKRDLNKLFYISGMIGRDHFFFHYPSKELTLDAHRVLGENLPGIDHWQWILRAGLNF